MCRRAGKAREMPWAIVRVYDSGVVHMRAVTPPSENKFTEYASREELPLEVQKSLAFLQMLDGRGIVGVGAHRGRTGEYEEYWLNRHDI